jgi:hypothetical protein
MISGTIQRGYVWLAAVPIIILLGLAGAIVYLLGMTLVTHGLAGINSGFLVGLGILILCLGMVGWRIANLRRTVHKFAYDGQTLSFQTLASQEKVCALAEIARVEYRPQTNSWTYRILLRDGGVLLLVPQLENGAELAKQLEMDLAYVHAAADISGDSALMAELSNATVDAAVLQAGLRRAEQWQTLGAWLMVLAAILFVSGFYFGGREMDRSGLPRNFGAEKTGDRFYAVKHRGGENPPSFEITAEQYALWKHGESIHGLFHFGACCCFLVTWVIIAITQRKPPRFLWRRVE